MKSLFALLLCLTLVTVSRTAAAAPTDALPVAALKAADDARVAAMKSADREGLAAALWDDLRYAHSTGAVDTKASYIESLTSGKTKYLGIDYEERDFSFPAPGIALMTGRARLRVATKDGNMDNAVSFLAVWRQEKGQWRFLAWQSCKLPAAKTP